MRKFLAVVCVILLLVPSGSALATQQSSRSDEELGLALLRSPEGKQLLEITRDLNKRARAADKTALADALHARDDAAIARLLGFAPDEANRLSADLTNLRLRMFARFPEIEQRASREVSYSCGFAPTGYGCGVDRAIRALAAMPENGGIVGPKVGGPNRGSIMEPNSEVGCEWGQYVLALTLCTMAGPWWYWPCAYLALCAYCEGGWVDQSCF